jgi:hypothetical protein
MSDNLIKHLEEYFQEWDLNEDEKLEVKKVCNETAKNFDGLYDIMKKMIESTEFRENVIDIIDQTFDEKTNDNEKDT